MLFFDVYFLLNVLKIDFYIKYFLEGKGKKLRVRNMKIGKIFVIVIKFLVG